MPKNVTLPALITIRKMKLIFNNFIFNNRNKDKILAITNDNKLTFKSHIKILCEKAAQKIGALSRLLSHLSDSQKRLILNSVIKVQFKDTINPLQLFVKKRPFFNKKNQ